VIVSGKAKQKLDALVALTQSLASNSWTIFLLEF
jgi:hypothetical protein